MSEEVTEESILQEVSTALAEPEITETPVEESVESPKQPEPEQPKYSDSEVKAMEQGWKPKEQFQGDQSEWRSAKEFLERGELFDHIRTLKKQNENLNQKVEVLVKGYKSVEEKTRERTLQELDQLQQRAVEEGDTEAVKRLTNQIVDIKKQPESTIEPQQNNETPQTPPEVLEFQQRNPWISSDSRMRNVAIAEEMRIRSEKPNLDIKEVLSEVERSVKELFPSKFSNNLQNKPSTVVAPSQEAPTKQDGKKLGWNDLGKELRDIYTLMKDAGVYKNLDDFIEEHKKLGVL